MKKQITLIYLVILLISVNSPSCSKSTEPGDSVKKTVEITDTTFVSNFVGDSIKLDISLPKSYNSDSIKTYPILYMTDGYWRKADHDTIHQMSNNMEIPEVIVVGIGYPDGYDFNNIRVRDLIINSNKLLSCIKEEIIPYIESKYRVNNNKRTLWGASYGAYFLVYAFTEHIKQGGLFKNYIGASATLNPPYNHVDLLKNEDSLWAASNVLPLNLYLTVGGLETTTFIDSYNNIVQKINSHSYKDFTFEYEIIPSTDHYTVWKPTLLKGLKMFLNK